MAAAPGPENPWVCQGRACGPARAPLIGFALLDNTLTGGPAAGPVLGPGVGGGGPLTGRPSAAGPLFGLVSFEVRFSVLDELG